MKISLFLICFVSLLLSSFISSQETDLIPFSLEDQFGRKFRDWDFRHWILVIIGSDKDGSKFAGIWGQAIRSALKDDPDFTKVWIVALSDLRGVPFFLKGWVKGKFPKNRAHWVLLDWQGVFAQAYSFEPKAVNILVFDCSGNLIHKSSVRGLEESKLKKIVDKIASVSPEC